MTDDRWRKVSEEMPLYFKCVLVWTPFNRCQRLAYYEGAFTDFHSGSDIPLDRITHWRPLPAPPEED